MQNKTGKKLDIGTMQRPKLTKLALEITLFVHWTLFDNQRNDIFPDIQF